ncbi:asialoglycoprotein receptor 1-like [Mya arenaria]|uniref:asialoglycoprotein receptor 1-like n=1 Tax=Mya arenaria TaxID=6604 RepID=UPI0022E4D83C|nr:asialoglycoprotein receptor 1-like [Mya arenaria]
MKRVFLLALFVYVLNGAYATSYTTCKDGWLAFDGSCYLFGSSHATFTEAEHYCRQHSSHLVHANNANENAFLKDFMAKLQTHQWWLGLTDEVVEGVWKWFDTDTVAEFTDFTSHEGNDGFAVDCAMFDSNQQFHWADVPCTSSRWPLCESDGRDSEQIVG